MTNRGTKFYVLMCQQEGSSGGRQAENAKQSAVGLVFSIRQHFAVMMSTVRSDEFSFRGNVR